jgi:hypothetical protein
MAERIRILREVADGCFVEEGVPRGTVGGGAAAGAGAQDANTPQPKGRRTTGDAKALLIDGMFAVARGQMPPKQLDSLSRGGIALAFLLFAEARHGVVDTPQGLEIQASGETPAIVQAKDNAA